MSIQVGSEPELSPRILLHAVGHSLSAARADTARIAGTVPDNSITGARILDGTIQRVDVAPSFKAPRADTADYAFVGTLSGSAGGDLTGTYPNPAIASGAVSTLKISDGAVTTPKLADNNITSAKIVDGGVGTADLADAAVTSQKISDGTVGTIDLANTAVTTPKVADGSITAAKIPASQVVKSINGLKDNLTMRGANGASVTTNGDTLTITASGGGGVNTLQNTNNTLDITNPNGPTVTANVKIPLSLSGSATTPNYLFTASNTAASGHGVKGSVIQGYGVVGIASATSGTTIGVAGNSSSPTGYAVSGYNLASSGEAVGVYGLSDSPTGVGVRGEGYRGVVGVSASPDGVGIRGEGADGVVGVSYGIGGDGVRGVSSGLFSSGVWGEGWDGVVGYATAATGQNYGVWGATNSSEGYAGYFNGSVHIVGPLSKPAGSFKIDHPLDPANKYLYHSFVESPDMMNIYNGNVALDGEGEAWVELPEWFEALNKDFRYQLTCIGGFAPVYVAEEISVNRFKIAGGKQGLKLSWQVTGIRKDAFAEKHRIPVEEEKQGEERGRYMHPEVFGLSKEMAIPSNQLPKDRIRPTRREE